VPGDQRGFRQGFVLPVTQAVANLTSVSCGFAIIFLIPYATLRPVDDWFRFLTLSDRPLGFRWLEVRDLGEYQDYRTARMPPINTGLLDGELAWRQHDGGHEDRLNRKRFIAWANRLLKLTTP